MAVKFNIYKNRHKDVQFTYKVDGTARDISASELIFAVYEKKGVTEQITKKNTAAGGGDTQISWVDDGTDGKFYVHLLPADTVSMEHDVYYYYEIRMVLTGKTVTIGANKFLLQGVSI